MDNDAYYKMLDASARKIRETDVKTERFLLKNIDWRDRLIQISGSRGAGKTTMLLQHMKSAFKDCPDAALYVSLDNLWFETNSLMEPAFRYKQDSNFRGLQPSKLYFNRRRNFCEFVM